MKNFRWCCKNENDQGCINHSEKDGCCLWLCTCEHPALEHELLEKGNSGCNTDSINKCKCVEFQFKSNDDCTLECQIQRKVYEQEV